MSQINVKNLCNENEDGAPNLVGVSTFSATSYMCPPKGTTAQRPDNPQGGDLRFNTDTASLEYFRGDTWSQIEMTSPDLDGGARGLFMGGGTYPAGVYDDISYITISTLGNDTTFGEIGTDTVNGTGCASRTRCISAGGATPTGTNVIEYVTFSSTGDATNFGDLTGVKEQAGGLSNATRGIFAGGYDYPAGKEEEIDYITMASTGDALDFGAVSYTHLTLPTKRIV